MKKFNLLMTAVFLIAALFIPSLLLASGKTLKVAIIAPSASNDLAFTQSIVDGIKAIQKDRKIDLAITDGTFIVEDAAAAIRDYAKKGYDLVMVLNMADL
jgi:basic membrane protein A